MSSVLLPLEPRGLNTGGVEAFASYFGRLALLHACSITQLARFLSSWRSRELDHPVKLNESTLYMTKGSGLSSYGVCVEAYVDAVEHAMGITCLRRCTLIPVRAALNPQRFDSVRHDRVWCEQCFREDRSSGSPVYDRLLWTLQDIARCHDHRVALRDTCPACGVTQQYQHSSGDPLLCWRCERPLIGPASRLRSAPRPSLGERDLSELVETISKGGPAIHGENPFHAFQRALDSIISPVASIVAGVAPVSGRARARKAEVKPTLRTMLRRSQAAGVTILQILEDPEGAATAAGQLVFDRSAIAATARVRHPKQVTKEICDAMEAELAKPRTEQIPRISELANRYGISGGFVRYHLRAMFKRYQNHRIAASVSLTHARRASCKALMSDPAHAASYVKRGRTVRKMAELLAVDADCPVSVARLEIRHYRARCERERRVARSGSKRRSACQRAGAATAAAQ